MALERRTYFHSGSLPWPPAEVPRTSQTQSWWFSWTLHLRVYDVVHSLHYDSYGSNLSNTLPYLNLGDCLMSGGVQTLPCPPGSGILLTREEATSRGYLPSWSWQKYVVNCLLWFFLKSITLWRLTLPDVYLLSHIHCCSLKRSLIWHNLSLLPKDSPIPLLHGCLTTCASTKQLEVEARRRSRRGQAGLPPEAAASYGNLKPCMNLPRFELRGTLSMNEMVICISDSRSIGTSWAGWKETDK